MHRRVEPEFLDELPASDPHAIKARQDLRRVNWFMRNTKLMTEALRPVKQNQHGCSLVELGAGDGTFLLSVARSLGNGWSSTAAVLVDRQNLLTPETTSSFEKLGWRVELMAADVFDWLEKSIGQNCDVVVANLFLHHFSEEQLSRLLTFAAERTRVFIAIDPRRWRWSVFACRLLRLIGCNAVTQHDAIVSVRAGFAGEELSRLWPNSNNGDWSLSEGDANFSSHLFVARKR